MVQVIDLTALGGTFLKPNNGSVPARIWTTNDILDFADFWPRSGYQSTARCFPFQTRQVLELSCETFAVDRNAEPLFVAIVNKKDEPLALIPLMIEHGRHTRVLRFLDGGMSEYNAPVLFPLVRDWDAGTVRMIWKAMRQIRSRFDLAIFEKMPAHVGDLPNPLHSLATLPYSESGHAITLSGTWDDFAAKVPHRRSLRESTNRLYRRGTPTFEIAKMPEQYDIYVEALIKQKSRQYLETWGFDGLDRPGYRRYLRGARRLVYPSGPVCLFALKISDTIISTNWGYLAPPQFYGVMQAYEGGEWRRYSPGRILFYKMIEWCFANKLDVLDCGVGNSEYKEAYCDISTTLYRAEIPVTTKGRLFQLMRNSRNKLNKLSQLAHLKIR